MKPNTRKKAFLAMALGISLVTPTFALGENSGHLQKLNLPQAFVPQCCVLLGYSGGDAFRTERPVAGNINYVR